VNTCDRDYQLMMRALADVTRRRDDDLDRAERAYQDSTARAAGELGRTEGDAASADRWAGAAAAQVLDVDHEAERLWEQLRRARGLRMRPLGEVPEPAPVERLARIALQRRPDDAGRASPKALLARAEMRIDDTVRPPGRRPLPRRILLLLPFLGALLAGAGGLLAAGLITIGEAGVPGGTMIRALGWLCFLVAPSAGVPVAALLARRRSQSRLNLTGITLTLLGGMLAATPLSLTFATSH